MQEITLTLNNVHSVGLGDNLCLISALATLPKKVILHTNNDHDTFNRLSNYVRMLRVPKDKLEIRPCSVTGTFDNTGWPLKVFTDYYKTDIVHVNNQLIKIDKSVNKKYIALVTAFENDPTGRNEWPWSRNRPIEYWAKIFAWIRSIGYEVITFDDPYIDLEKKLEIMAKDCQAIITYEGGMAHLAHMIDMPCFIVDWKHQSPSTNLNVFHVDFVHRSNSVYILRNDIEILNWDRLAFDLTVTKLKEGKGNNRFESKEFSFNFVGPNFHNDLRIYNKDGLLCLQTSTFLSKMYADLMFEFYQNR
jgi:hypothetical protein